MHGVNLIIGLAGLIVGAEFVVRFGVAIARRLKISPIIIGLTVVSVGTSLPELAVCIEGIQQGSGNLVLGNLVGTNIVNILLIMGLAALIRPIVFQRSSLRIDLPAMIIASLLLWAFTAWNGDLTTLEGVILLGFGCLYTWRVIATARTRDAHDDQIESEIDTSKQPRPGAKYVVFDVFMMVVGIVIIVVGANWLLEGAVGLATDLGLSETLIGLTIVAIGTSAPEIATMIAATIKGERAIAVGNLIGSSTLNLTLILGSGLLFGPRSVEIDPTLITFDMPIMVGVALVCIPLFVLGKKISRFEGGLMVAAYVGYLTFLIVTAVV